MGRLDDKYSIPISLSIFPFLDIPKCLSTLKNQLPKWYFVISPFELMWHFHFQVYFKLLKGNFGKLELLNESRLEKLDFPRQTNELGRREQFFWPWNMLTCILLSQGNDQEGEEYKLLPGGPSKDTEKEIKDNSEKEVTIF